MNSGGGGGEGGEAGWPRARHWVCLHDVRVCACCSAHGFNFGPGAGVNGDTVRRQLLLRQTTSNGAPVPGATFSADRAIPVSWDHGEVVVVTDLRYGEAKVVITAVDGRGRVVTQESPVSQFLDFSPSLRTAPGQATTQFSTGGGQVGGCSTPPLLSIGFTLRE